MIRRAVTQDLPRLKQIWADCFGDSTKYIEFYYQNRFHEVETFVYEKNAQIVSMLTLISAEIVKGMVNTKAKYIYAVATDPDFQKQGIAKKLLEVVCNEQAKEKIELFLVPATESLFAYYKKCGFVTTADQIMITIQPDQITNQFYKKGDCDLTLNIRQLTPKIWDQAREKTFCKDGYVRWDLKGLTYLLKEWEFWGGMAWEVRYENVIGAILFHIDSSNQHLFVKEAAMPKELFEQVISKIVKQFQIKEIKVISADHTLSGKRRSFAMSYNNPSISTLGYVNFVKD